MSLLRAATRTTSSARTTTAIPALPQWKRRWLTLGGFVLLAVMVMPAWRQWDYFWRVREGSTLLASERFDRAAEVFHAAAQRYPADSQLAFLEAVAWRRDSKVREFEVALARAEELGWPAHEIKLQRLLAQTQHGLGNAETEKELDQICMQGADDFTAEQIYEARAKGYMSLYQIQNAMQALNFWTEWRPDSVTPRLLRAQLHEQLENLRFAEEDYEAIVKSHPAHFEARVKHAQMLLMNQKQAEAKAAFEECQKTAPNDPRVILALAEIRIRDGEEIPGIEQKLRELASESQPGEVRQRALALLANIYIGRKKYEEVVNLLEGPASSGQLAIAAYNPLVRAFVALRRRDKAEHFQKLLDEKLKRRDDINRLYEQIGRRSTDPDLRFRMGELFFLDGSKEGALTWWYTAILAEPLHQLSHEALADYYASVGDVTRVQSHRAAAERSVERTFELAWQDYVNDDLTSVQERLAAIAKYKDYRPYTDLLICALDVRVKQERFNPARLETLRRLLDYPNLRSQALTILGAGLMQLGRYPEAERALLEVITNDPHAIEAHRWLASLNFDTRALFRARHHCDEIARLSASDHKALHLKGTINNMLSFYGEAVENYEESLRRNPHQPTRQEVLLEMAECQQRIRKYEDALKTLEQIDDSVAGDALKAQCLLSLGRVAESRQEADDVLRRDEKNLMANLVRADVAIQEKDDELALKRLQTITAALPFEETAWFKQAQIYARQKRDEEAKQARDRVEEIRALRNRYLTIEEDATEQPYNVDLRRQLSVLARQLGRDDLAEMWQHAVELLEAKPSVKPPSPLIIEAPPAANEPSPIRSP